MIRIVDGVAYMGTSGDRFRIKAYDLGHGHLEVTASRTMIWEELDWSPEMIADHLAMMEKHREEHAVEIREQNAQSAAQRAKKNVRHLCKVMGADTMLTLTYRANQCDLQLCKKHLREFQRRMRRVLPDFSAVCAFERQERGAWHVHIATKRIPITIKDRNKKNEYQVKSYELIRRIWRSVTKEHGGNIDVSRRKNSANQSPAQIASYIAGYIVKEFAEGEAWSNRWTKFGDVTVPPAIILDYVMGPTAAVEAAMSLVSDLQRVVTSRLDRWQDWYVVHAELTRH